MKIDKHLRVSVRKPPAVIFALHVCQNRAESGQSLTAKIADQPALLKAWAK